ncbi:TonB-dependent receptor [Fulvivirgaceae bacterium BMA12]|uniref:TonB-dependent receptor n=1 Tax=Agaribacillus aureus TaxID=3051825 RepID=A0ABT8L2N4_9BACT|nr:TonB-dependent receptor [Fulvivirgaceae bacterium BMA12]
MKANLRLIWLMTKNTLYGFCIHLLCSTMLIASPGTAQHKSLKDITLSVQVSDVELVNLFAELESRTSFNFSYNDSQVNEFQKLSLELENQSLYKVLRRISQKTGLSFKRIDDNIFVRNIQGFHKAVEEQKIEERILANVVISGKVTDENGNGLPGASVVLKGTSNGTITDAEGNYTLNVPEDATITVSFVGYLSQHIEVGSQTVINVQMVADTQQLAEIVVVGYGTQQKVNLTGAVAAVSGDVLEKRPIVSVGQGLQGVIPNLNVDIRNGDPSEPIDFNIRGYESINGGNPLVLVDGVPMDLNKINPNDIASISVLKDASAAAVYGARAAFGVVLVETKKGKSGKMKINFAADFAAAKPIMFIDPVTDPYQYALARNLATERTNGAPSFDQEYLDNLKIYSDNPTEENAWGVTDDGELQFYGFNNYQERILADFSPQRKYDMSISGATDKASYYVSFGYLSKDGYLKNDDKNEKFKRYNALIKGDVKINEWLSLDSRALVTIETSDKPHFYNWDVNINTFARVNPLNPISFPDLPYYLTPGDREDFAQFQGMHFQSVNFLPYLEQGGRDTWTRNDVILTQGATLNPIKGLNIRGEFSVNTTNRDAQDVRSKVNVIENMDLNALQIGEGFSATDYINNRNDDDQYYVINAYADYTIDKFEGHNIKVMAGFNQEWGKFQYIRARAFGLITPAITDLNATTGNQETYGGKEEVSLRGAFYRVNYNYKDRYLFEANGRYDGTSRFPKDDRFGFFPSFSAAWRISNEAFMSGTSVWLDNLKVRLSYGTLGNQLIFEPNGRTPIYYPAIPTLGSATSPYMFTAGARTPYVSAAGLVSPTLTWESVTSKNLGIDFTMFNNRLDFTFDLYTRETKDMLTDVELPDILGTDAPKANAADLITRGWEISATWRTRINENWNYGITLALADSEAEITKYDNPTGSLDERYVGQIIGEKWGFVTQGIFQTDDEVAGAADQSDIGNNWRPGDIRYADLDGDGKITRGDNTLENPGDQQIIAYERPRGNFGITGNVGYKGFTLTMFFQGVLKYDYLPPNNNWVAFYPFNAGHVENYYLTDTWSEDNRDAYFPAPHISTNTKQNVQPQSRYVQDAAYIRLKNITLNYNIPANIAGKIGLSNASIYISGMNVWEATKMRKPLDPEVRPTLTQEYYKQRIYSLGLNVSF